MLALKFILNLFVCCLLGITLNAQELTQVIRGRVTDAETRVPLPFASVAIITIDPVMGVITDNDGYFRLEKVPVGRHDLRISYVGYEPKNIPELMVSSSKEIVLTIKLKEQVAKIDEVVVKAYTKKDKPLNSMATLSARTFSVEEAQRYAGGLDDPARLASSFAGITTGDLNENGIVIRGNAPKGLLWRLEGVEIPNPNHFAGFTSFGGGAVSALSSLMLSNSDFYTGAFPAEYGNAMSGVFDIKLRTGNNETYEHAIQLGTSGIDISSEGPLGKNKRASYLFNYRYSTFAIVKHVLPDFPVPVYQDFCMKINVPTQKSGVFSLWMLASDDQMDFEIDSDTAAWRNFEDQEEIKTAFRTGAAGLNHKYILGDKTYINSTIAISGDYISWEQNYVDYDFTRTPMHDINNTNYRLTYSSTLSHKFSAKHTNRSGIIISNLNSNMNIDYAAEIGDDLQSIVNEDVSSMNYRFYSQSGFSLNPKLTLNLGLHGQFYDLNNEFIIGPRAGLSYSFTEKQSLSFAYGKHSRLEPLFLYSSKVMDNGEITYPNKSLELAKAHHFVLAYDISFNPNLRLKIEPYFQYLYDVPVIPDSSYSTINMEADWFFTDKLTNDGTGTNWGIDITLERFLKNGYYYLFTASLFESKYIGGDNIERNTRYNTNFVFNLLFGKEWILGAGKNKILCVSGRLNVFGGQYATPVITDYPYQKGDEVLYDYSRPFSEKRPDVYRLNASVNYRINKRKHSSVWQIQVLNILGMEEYFGYIYDYKKGKVTEDKETIIFPSLSYKIEF